jgi:hypothetical protein
MVQRMLLGDPLTLNGDSMSVIDMSPSAFPSMSIHQAYKVYLRAKET